MEPYLHEIKYYETDKMGITHHSNYIRVMEEARIDFLNKIGYSYSKLEEQGIISPVISVEGNYRKTTTFPEVLSVTVEVEKLSSCKLTFSYTFKSGENVVFTGKSSHCFLNDKGEPVIVERQFPELHKTLKSFLKG